MSNANVQGADEAFLQKAGIPSQQIYALKEGLPVEETAKEYEGQLLRVPQQVLPRNSAGLRHIHTHPCTHPLHVLHID